MEKRLIESEALRRDKNVKSLKRAIAKLPEGKISYSLTKGKYYYRILRNGKYVSISYKNEKDYIDKLIIRQILESRLLDEQNFLRIDKEYINQIDKTDKQYEKMLDKYPEFEKLLKDFYKVNDLDAEKLLETDIEDEPPFKECLKFRTNDGTLVRSKTEGMIYNELLRRGYIFRYERPLKIYTGICFPDFTIVHPENKNIIIWEHLGMLDDPTYLKKNTEKIIGYIRAGYIPGVNLIITWESSDKVFDSKEMMKVMDLYFN